jgi:hypothetical protein
VRKKRKEMENMREKIREGKETEARRKRNEESET